MSNHRIVFYGTPESDSEQHELTCVVNFRGEMYVSIEMEDLPPSFICLDKSTSIKFAKTLRTEINKMANE